ncbi:MAG: DUF3367 domain-containing protein, partial [Actinomycetia bacterium]|nr:DUF3367 domain-containing protein [Actinomycetes bacterium]
MTERVVERVREATGAVVLVGVALIQSPGRIVADTKLDLVLEPGGFLARSLQAWDPQAAFGQLQNQAYGYLFPMGPFFWAGHALGVPAWIVQRLWWVLLLLVAYAGLLRLARALGMGTPATRLIAAMAYALAPRVVTVLGAISVEALPMAVLPWVLLPLVRGTRGGSPRRAAALSALAVAAMGGVNAAATLAVLVVPLVFLLTRARGPRARRLLAWWLGCTALAVSWWMLPLVVLGRYAYPFLDYIETSAVTTSVASATNVLRGVDHWLGFLVTGDGATWPAGYELAARPLLVAATVAVAGLGLAGIAARTTPERRFLGWSVLVGMLLVGIGYAGPGGSPLAEPVQALLDGPLAAFRNVHKFDPVVRLPLALGLAAALARAPEAARRLSTVVPGEEGVWLRARPALTGRLAHVAAVALLALAALPALAGRLAPPGTFEEVPDAWAAAADWLADREGEEGGRALLVPASQFGDYTWGRPADEPLQALAASPWAVRNAVPLGAPGATRLLDAVESELALGRGSALLAPTLRRAGVQYLLLRNDLDAFTAGTPPIVARATLLGSPGLTKVAGFGGSPDPFQWSLFAAGRDQPEDLESLEVFAVDGTAERVTLLRADAVGLSGGPEATLGTAAGLEGRALVAVADGGRTAPAVITDTLRRRAKAFGSPTPRDYTPTLRATDDVLRGRPAGDVLPYSGPPHETVAVLVGARGVTASSSAAEPAAVRPLGPAVRPAAAVDGDPRTAWVSDAGDSRPRLRVELARAVQTGPVTVSARDLPANVPTPRSVTVRTDAGDGVARFVDGVARVRLPAGATTTLELTVEPGGDGSSGVGISEVTPAALPAVAEPLALPRDAATGASTRWVLAREPGARRSCVLPGPEWACQPSLTRPAEERILDRLVDLGSATSVGVEIDVVPRQGAALEDLVDAAVGVSVSASSRLVADVAARPGAALDGDPATAWLATPADARPTLTVRYPAP